MLRIAEIPVPLSVKGNAITDYLLQSVARRLQIVPDQVHSLKIYKKSIDARKKEDIHFIYTVEVEIDKEGAILKMCKDKKVSATSPYHYEMRCSKRLDQRPVVVGFGPAGMFAALILAQAGQCPIVLERGSCVEERTREVEAFWKTGFLDPESNVQFGEGGAGTFSDGKLNTGTKDGRARKVLEELVRAGAPEEILYLAHPHVGTDHLPRTVKGIREEIIALGGEIHFRTKLIKVCSKAGEITGVEVQLPNGSSEIWDTDSVILAIGHSARDTYELLYGMGIVVEPKPFSVGARIEHPQGMINKAQFGKFAEHPALGAAEYRLSTHLRNGRGVYTFCMCPGGTVVAAASEEGGVVTNGMSSFARDQENANSALLVGVGPDDFGSDHPLAGMHFQRRLEQAAFALGNGSYAAPLQRVEDLLQGRKSIRVGDVCPSYGRGVVPCALSQCLPDFVVESMREGILDMERKLRGFAYPDAILTGVETRSSAPVRLLRGDDFQSVSLKGLFPCGEGAGYAGGIISAAVDGIKCAEQILKESNFQ